LRSQPPTLLYRQVGLRKHPIFLRSMKMGYYTNMYTTPMRGMIPLKILPGDADPWNIVPQDWWRIQK
jgi:hypothetical protein